MTQLQSVDSATATATPHMFTLSLTADIGDGAGMQSGVPFGWDSRGLDPFGLSPAVTAWMAAHLDFPVTPYVAPPAPIQDLAPYQFRAMLVLSGKKGALDDFIAALPDPEKTVAQAKLEYSLTFQRDNSLVLAAQSALALTDEQLDALWLQAAAIE